VSNLDILKREVNHLENFASAIVELVEDLISKVSLWYENVQDYEESEPYRVFYWARLTPEAKLLQRNVIREYQGWYSSAYQLIKEYLPERLDEFNKYYTVETGVLGYLQFKKGPYSYEKLKFIEEFIDIFEFQRSILVSVANAAEIKELALRKIITADFIKTEIEQAETLFTGGFHRAAGTIAGVALEKHLKTLCDMNGVSYSQGAAIQSVAQSLRTAEKISVTDTQLVTYLASIRNKCSHAQDVSADEIESLIEGVKKLLQIVIL
jgi:hypothetical protein